MSLPDSAFVAPGPCGVGLGVDPGRWGREVGPLVAGPFGPVPGMGLRVGLVGGILCSHLFPVNPEMVRHIDL